MAYARYRRTQNLFDSARSSLACEVYIPKDFLLHAALLGQAFAHCPKFPTAASRRSLARVSVPVWLAVLSDQLQIAALVGHYPTNKLICRRLLSRREALRSPALTTNHHSVPLHYAVLARLSASYSPPGGRLPTCYSPGRHSTCPRRGFRVRLACVRHAASVDSEPGSNSQSKSWSSQMTFYSWSLLLKRSNYRRSHAI